jgi:NhaP-type Na+/H+ or K+/H+ antiporter
MITALWYAVAGVLLVGVALASSSIARLPVTTALLYLCIGFVLGPEVTGLLRIDALADARLLERLSEVAVIVSLFGVGLKLRVPMWDERWSVALRLASGSMMITVGLITLVGVVLLGLPLGGAVLLGAILAPTDPVLASDVQVGDPFDRDRLRFSLTGEAGLNDGTAFPFVMLGLGLLGLHDLGDGYWRWLTIDVVWAVTGGLLVGTVLGTLIGRLVLYLRRTHHQALGTDDFIAMGLIALTYGVALLCHTYGFLAVFTAGLALRRVEMHNPRPSGTPAWRAAPGDHESAVHPHHAPAYLAEAVRRVTEILERGGEIVLVLLVGALLSPETVSLEAAGFAALLLLVLRPIAVALGLVGQTVPAHARRLMAWFGIRGIGSVYYLAYAIGHGVPEGLARQLVTLVLTTIALSTLVHGTSVTTLMARYERRPR